MGLIGIENIDAQIKQIENQIRKIEDRLASADKKGGSLIYQHLGYLGAMGLARLQTDTYGKALLPEGDMREGWDYIVGPDFLSWFNERGHEVKGEVNRNLITHFLDEGTVAHGPAVKEWLHFFIDGQEIFTKWVEGIQPHYIFNKLRNFIIKKHNEQIPVLMANLFRDI